MLSTDLIEKSKGVPGCSVCDGNGLYIFQGCRIFCEKCHGENGVNALWGSVDNIITKTHGKK